MKNVAKEKGDDDCLPNSTCVNHHQKKGSFQTRIEYDTQLTEFRTEGHYEERVGTNIL